MIREEFRKQMHLQLRQIIAYRDNILDEEERKKVEQHLAECAECRTRLVAFEHLAVGLKGYFATHRPVKGKDCPDETVLRRYLSGELDEAEKVRWKEHLSSCDYCFGIIAALKKESLQETDTEPLQLPDWLRRHVEASGSLRERLPLRKRWTHFSLALREAWVSFVVPHKWVCMVASLIIVIFAGWLVWHQVAPTDSPHLAYSQKDKHSLNSLGVAYHQQALSKVKVPPHGEWRLAMEMVAAPDVPTPKVRGDSSPGKLDKKLLRQAIIQFETCLKVDRQYKVAYKNLGDVYSTLGEFEKANEAYQQALSIDPQYIDALNNLGILLCRQKQFEKGIRVFQQVLRIDKSNLEARYNLALAYEYTSRPEEARQAWRAYLKLDKNSSWADRAREHLIPR